MADMHSLARLASEGFTAVLDALDVFDPTMEVACRALQWWSLQHVQVNAYLTTRDATGFPLHFDDHNVLIVQLAGHKSWEVRGSSRAVPMYRDAEPNLAPSEEVIWSGTLRAGEVMHIPRGHWHQATRADCGTGLSLHVTFGFEKPISLSDWLAWMAARAREDWLWSPPEESLIRCGQGPVRTRVVPALTALDESSSVVCVTEFPPQVEEAGEHVLLFADGKKLTFEAAATPALRRLVSGDPVQVAQVSARTGVDARQLGDVLIREGFCTLLTDELSSGYTGLITGESY